jgi:small-conductance mechanosensitive channel
MKRSLMVALAVIAIFSIAYVLITPDPNDDIDGVLRPNRPIKVQRLLAVSIPQFQIVAILAFYLFTAPSFSRRLTASELLDFVCVCRC